jgi:hypothetical protein
VNEEEKRYQEEIKILGQKVAFRVFEALSFLPTWD